MSKMFSNIVKLKFILTGIFIFSFISWSFFCPVDSERFWGLSQKGAVFGFITGVRLIGMVASGVFFLSTTSIEEISLGLVRFKVPYSVSFVLSTALRLVQIGRAHV